MIFLAHGIGGVRDLPVPESFFFTTAAIVLVVSFVLLGSCGSGRCSRRTRTVVASPRDWAPSCSRARVRVALQVVSVALFALTFATARVRHDRRAPELRADVRLRRLLARRSVAVRAVRERVAGTEPVARARGLDGVAPRGVGPAGAPRSRVDGSVGSLPGGRCALLVRGTGAREPSPRIPAHARDRHRPVLVLGARGDGGLRTRRMDAVGRGVRGRVRAPVEDLGIRRARGPGRRALAVHRPRRRRAPVAGRSPSSR